MNDNKNNLGVLIPIILGLLIVIIGGYFVITNNHKFESGEDQSASYNPVETRKEGTFSVDDNLAVVNIDGKPVVYLFSTTTCPHCKWIKETFDKVAKEYMDQGKIIAYHWEMDIKDNSLTEDKERSIPNDAMNIYRQFNPRNTVPTFVIGGKYWRVGNGYESQDGLEAEEKEFRTLFNLVIAENSKDVTP